MSQTVIQDNIYISAKINGEFITGFSAFKEILVVETLQASLPMAKVTWQDASLQSYRDLQLTDGATLELEIGKLGQGQTKTTFRRFSDRGSRSYQSGQDISAVFLMDAAKYTSKALRKAKKGNSSDIISEMAGECGLTAVVDATSDEQVWFSAGQTYNTFANQVAKNGYISDSSCMILAVTSDGKLLYKDINKAMVGEAKKKLYSSTLAPLGDKAVLLIANDIARSTSGFSNQWINYGYKKQKWGIIGEVEDYEKINAQTTESNLSQSSMLKQEVEIARVDLTVFDCGNTHKDFYKAEYQNLRYKALYTESLSVIIQDVTELNLLDVVDVMMGESVGEDLSSMRPSINSGKYVVYAKTKVIRNGVIYGERLELIRNSVRNKGNNPLV